MKQYTVEEIQARFEQLPPELQAAITSPEVNSAIEAVGKKHGLLIDQLGEMVDKIGLVMLGLMPSNEFVKSLSRDAGVDADTASAIASDINTEVFGKIKSGMRSVESSIEPAAEPVTDNLSSLEKAGGFTIEREIKDTPRYGQSVTEADKDDILAGIENPAPSTSSSVPKMASETEDAHKEPLADHLLQNSVAEPEKKVTREASIAPNKPLKSPGPAVSGQKDPYREPIE